LVRYTSLEVSFVHLVHGQDADQAIQVVAKRDHDTLAQGASGVTGGQRDRQRPWRPVAERRMLDNALVVGAALEPVQGRVRTAAEQRDIRSDGRRDPQGDELVGARIDVCELVGGHQQIDQRSPEGRDERRCCLCHSGLS
jgi:hypothetical protein